MTQNERKCGGHIDARHLPLVVVLAVLQATAGKSAHSITLRQSEGNHDIGERRAAVGGHDLRADRSSERPVFSLEQRLDKSISCILHKL